MVFKGGERRSRSALLFFGLLAVQAQQELIQFADGLQTPFEIAIVFQRLTNLWNLAGPQTHLAGFSARIAHCEYPERMAITAGTFPTARGETPGAVGEGASSVHCG